MYCAPFGTQSGGFYFENFHNNNYNPSGQGPFFDEAILKPRFGMSTWLGNADYQGSK